MDTSYESGIFCKTEFNTGIHRNHSFLGGLLVSTNNNKTLTMILKEKIVKTLHSQLIDNELKFYWFITIVYHKKVELNDVRSDNKRLKYVIRKFFRSDIRFGSSTKSITNQKNSRVHTTSIS